MILFVDDEPSYVKTYVEELEFSGYQVCLKREVDAAARFLEEHLKDIKLIVLDIMMPPGTTFKDAQTELGRRTGLRFFELLQEKAPNLSVIVLTNVSEPAVEQWFSGQDKCRYLRKEECLPFELVEEVREILGPGQTSDPQVEARP